MDNETYKQIVLSYIPYGVQVQYEGILNGKEKSDYQKEYNALTDNKSGFLDSGFPIYNPPVDVVGLKRGLIKRVSFWKNYINLEIGIKSEGLKRFALNLNTEPKFKLVLRPLSYFKTMSTVGQIMKELLCTIYNESDIYDLSNNQIKLENVSNSTMQVMFKNHIDYGGLIQKGLAVDINTLTK